MQSQPNADLGNMKPGMNMQFQQTPYVPTSNAQDGGSLIGATNSAQPNASAAEVKTEVGQSAQQDTSGDQADGGNQQTGVEYNFDDFDESTLDPNVPLPPLFAQLFERPFSLPQFTDTPASETPGSPESESILASGKRPSMTTSTIDLDEDSSDSSPASQTQTRIQAGTATRAGCDKPECNFDAVSCALPAPWRPPPVTEGADPRELLGCKQAWAKLCSHPLFDDCDVDELCHELRAKAKCSESGFPVIEKDDVLEIFRSIPARAQAKERRGQNDQTSLNQTEMGSGQGQESAVKPEPGA